MDFLTDDIFRLGGNQRAKLQYHILSQRFSLAAVSASDKQELEAFAAASETETAQRWLNRMKWPQGHEKMVTFGAALEVPDKEHKGADFGLWCYHAKVNETGAVYQGISMDWETWAFPLVDYLTAWRAARRWDMVEVMQGAMLRLYYQNGLYLTVPKAVRVAVVKWVYQFLKDGAAPFPFDGDMGSEEYKFIIDFERDVEIVSNSAIKDDMAAYNREANAEKGRRRVEKRFADLQGDKWTTTELTGQGFTKRNIATFVNHGLIKRLYQGHYERVSK